MNGGTVLPMHVDGSVMQADLARSGDAETRITGGVTCSEAGYVNNLVAESHIDCRCLREPDDNASFAGAVPNHVLSCERKLRARR
jgi:hypothetical protein